MEWSQLFGYLPGSGHSCLVTYRGVGPVVWIPTGEWHSCMDTYRGVGTVPAPPECLDLVLQLSDLCLLGLQDALHGCLDHVTYVLLPLN